MSFLIKYDKVWKKCKQVWGVIKNKLKIKFHSLAVYDKEYLKTKVIEYDGVTKTNVLGTGIRLENLHYTCIACITVNSVMKMDKKYFPQVYFEECKYKMKKIQISRFINAELDLDSNSDSESDDELKSDSDNDSDNDSHK